MPGGHKGPVERACALRSLHLPHGGHLSAASRNGVARQVHPVVRLRLCLLCHVRAPLLVRPPVVSPSAPPTAWVGHNGRLPIESYYTLTPRVPPSIVQALGTIDGKPLAGGLPGGHLRPRTVGRSAQHTGHGRYLPMASRYRLAALLVVCFVGRLLQCHFVPPVVVCLRTPLSAFCIHVLVAFCNPRGTFLGHMAKF